MTVANLFAQHRAGKVSKEKFLYEVRRDAQLPFISNLTSYEDAIKMLKQKSIIKEIQKDINGTPLHASIAQIMGPDDPLAKKHVNDWTPYDHERFWHIMDMVRTTGKAPGPLSGKNRFPVDEIGKLVKEGVNTTDKFDVVLKNGKKYHNVTFTTHNSFETEDGVSMMNQDIAKTTKSPEKQGGLNESKKIIKEAKFGVYIPNGTKEGTKLDIAVEYKNHPYAKIYFDAEFVSDKDGKYTFNTKEGKIKIPHADLVTYRKSSQKQEGLNESKKIIKEQTDLHLQIDRLNPILVKKAVNSELAKLPMIDAAIYQKTTEKVVKKLQKDPKAYDDVVVANAKEIHKIDEKSKMVPVKKELKDPHHQMKSPKGAEKHKSNTKASKTENKKGKPKGVKEMSSTAKGHKGVEQMKHPEKNHKIMESLLSFMFKKKLNEDTHHEYGVGQAIDTPDGRGTVKEIIGSTVTLEFESTGDLKDYQMNVLTHFREEAKKPVEEKTPEVKKEMPTMDEKKDKVIQKVMEFLKKKKKMTELKKGAVNIRTSNPKNPDSTSIQTAQNLSARGVDTVFVSDTNK